MEVVVEVVVAFVVVDLIEIVMGDGQHPGRPSPQPTRGASRVIEPLMTATVYTGLRHDPTSNACPVYATVGKAIVVVVVLVLMVELPVELV